jgi:hypothetical protein
VAGVEDAARRSPLENKGGSLQEYSNIKYSVSAEIQYKKMQLVGIFQYEI